jgi:hypothetical protein
VYWLGEARYEAAIPLMVSLIEIRDTQFSLHDREYMPHWPFFPCAIAIQKLGIPAIDPLLDRMESSATDSVAFEISCITLEAMLGAPLARAVIERRSLSSKAKLALDGRLEKAFELIGWGHRWWRVAAL